MKSEIFDDVPDERKPAHLMRLRLAYIYNRKARRTHASTKKQLVSEFCGQYPQYPEELVAKYIDLLR